jgi:hypothetical protein
MSESVIEVGSEAALRNRESFFSAYRSVQERAAEVETPGGEEQRIDGWHDDFRQPSHPYPGLRSFNSHEGGVFFGRERNIRDIRERLSNHRVVVVLGGSGSGKSSVIRAGLMPKLNSTMAIKGRSGNWYTVEFRPRLNPMEELEAALAGLVRSKFPEQGMEIPVEIEPGADTTGTAPEDVVLAGIRDGFQLGGEGEEVAKISVKPGHRTRRAEMLCERLFEFVDNELDRRDRAATRGYRSGRPNLLLVIDQFEEVFRPEVPIAEIGGRQDLLDTIIAACARIEAQPVLDPEKQSGLFIAITMRSEELHRCAEHPSLGIRKDGVTKQRSLADLVNRSGYLLDLLDPEQDRRELEDAIVQPARRVFEDWGLPLDRNDEHAPFEPNVVGWLLDGAAQISQVLDHRADQLPLLQHALQTMWQRAVEEWEKGGPALIGCRHLNPDGVDNGNVPADLVACLDTRANEARESAIQRYAGIVRPAEPPAELPQRVAPSTQKKGLTALVSNRFQKTPPPAEPPFDAATEEEIAQADAKYTAGGEAAIRAAFRSLARRDDRGNWARRFAEFARVKEFLDADPRALKVSPDLQERGVRAALHGFISAGYLTGGDGRPYDISHEALIRNWPHCQLWLLEPEASAQALVEAVNFLDLNDPPDFISLALARNLALAVGDRATLPRSWAREQIIPVLSRPDVREKWIDEDPDDAINEQAFAEDVLKSIDWARKYVEEERFQYEQNKYLLHIRELEATYYQRYVLRTRRIAGVLAVVLLLTWLGVGVKFAPVWFWTMLTK